MVKTIKKRIRKGNPVLIAIGTDFLEGYSFEQWHNDGGVKKAILYNTKWPYEYALLVEREKIKKDDRIV